MIIERNGEKIELTPKELRLAFEEYESNSVKEDIASVFAVDYLGCVDAEDFYCAIKNFSLNEGFYDLPEANKELFDSFGEETISWLVNNPDEFLTAAYKVYNDNLDANEDYNSQVEYAVKTVLCDKSFHFKLDAAREWINKGELVPNVFGFEYKGTHICNPFMDETGRFEVDPDQYYGGVNISRFLEKFSPEKSVEVLKDTLWNEVKGYNSSDLKAFVKEDPVPFDFSDSYSITVYSDSAEDVPCWYVVARAIGSEDDIVSVWTSNLSREGFDECVESVFVSLTAHNKSRMVMAEKEVQEPLYDTEVTKVTTISFTTNEGPDATQFDTQDPTEVMELFVQLLEENNLKLISVDGVIESEIVEKVPRVSSVDEMLKNANQTCEEVNKGVVGKNNVEFGKE